MSKFMKSTYEYTKKRKSFGREPLFQNVPAHLVDSIYPNKADQKQYILRNPVNRFVQATLPQSQNETNTKQLVTKEGGINHVEGGWPRDVHLYNEDHVFRHRRRVMHDESYINAISNLAPAIEHYVNQNNAIDMYQTYFAGMSAQEPVEKYAIRVANVFRDKACRPVSCIAWTLEKKSHIAVSYSDRIYSPESLSKEINKCYLWDTNVQNEPAHEFHPNRPCWQIACSPKDPEVIVGGLEDGTVSLFDIRGSTKAVSASSVYKSHREPITSLLYIHSRTQTEFFTGSSDGQCLWWDTRNLLEPTNQLPMSINIPAGEIPSLSNSEGVSALEFDPGLPTKFLCGSDSGYVINVNRLGRAHSEMLSSYWNAHWGPVRSVYRSPCTMRMFLTCGDYSVRIWSEEVRTAPIIVTQPYRHEVADACWAPLRYSSYMSGCAGGYFYYWDLLRKSKEPVATLQVSKGGITKLVPQREGHSVAIGDTVGSVILVNLSENMVISGNRDKQLMQQVYERETKREHILDNRVKEIHLKQKLAEEAAAKGETQDDIPDEEELIENAEDEYFRIINDELQKMEIVSSGNASIS